MGREGCCKPIRLACACSVSATLGLSLPMAHTAQALGCSTGNCLKPSLGFMHLPGLSHSGSGTRVVLRYADSFGHAFCALSKVRVAQVFGEHGCCDLWPLPSLLLSFLGAQLAHLLRQMMTFFKGNELLIWVPDVLTSIQKLFCGICSAFKCSFDEIVGKKVVSPSYSSSVLRPPSLSVFF